MPPLSSSANYKKQAREKLKVWALHSPKEAHANLTYIEKIARTWACDAGMVRKDMQFNAD